MLPLFTGGCWVRRQLPNGIWYISVGLKLMNLLSSVQGILGIKLAEAFSTADYSTTVIQILMLLAEGCYPGQRL